MPAMPMKKESLEIVHIVSGDLWAGAEVQVFQLCCALQNSQNIKVSAITFNTGVLKARLQQAGISVKVVDETSLSPFAMVVALVRLLKAQPPDIIHTHGQKENILGTLAAVLARVRHRVRTVHGNPENSFSLKRPHKLLLSFADYLVDRYLLNAIVAVSDQLKARLETSYPRKVHKINNFIHIENLRRENASHCHKSLEGPLKIGFVGRLVPVKRVDMLIETLAILRDEYQINFKANIIGEGPLEHELKYRVKQLGLSSQVDFQGFIDPVYSAIASLDLMVLTSDHEGLPMILIEAQALEVPIIAHAVGGIPEVLAQGRAGTLINDHTATGYAKAISDFVISDSAQLMTQRALAHAREHFGSDINIKKYLNFYKSLSNYEH